MPAEHAYPSPHDEPRDLIDCSEVPHLRKRRFILKSANGRRATLTLLWTTRFAWQDRPESAAGSPWHTWRLGPFCLSYRLDP
jgi:hypothetical protein